MVEPIADPEGEPVEQPLRLPSSGPAAEPQPRTETQPQPQTEAAPPVSESAPEPGRIVVGVDGSEPSHQALRWAARQAVLTRSSLDAVLAYELPGAYGWTALPELPEDVELAGPARKALATAVEAALPPEQVAAVNQVVVLGNPAQAILDQAVGAELIVVGGRGHGTFRATVLGSVSHSVTTHAICPVVVVHGTAGAAAAAAQGR
jgi:nucleotide-binding universal stress UspA family protein